MGPQVKSNVPVVAKFMITSVATVVGLRLCR